MRGYVEYLIYPIFCEYETMEMNLIISNNIIHITLVIYIYIYIIVYIDIKELFFLDLHFRETEFPETKMKKNF